MAYGLKISKVNKDVKTAPEKDLIITSNRESLKLKLSGGETYNYPYYESQVGPQILTKTYNHNLSYIPFVLAFVETSNNSGIKKIIPLDDYSHLGLGVDEEEVCQLEVNESQIIITYYYYTWSDVYFGGGWDVTFSYYIFANPIELQPLPRVSSEGPWLDRTYGDLTFGG